MQHLKEIHGPTFIEWDEPDWVPSPNFSTETCSLVENLEDYPADDKVTAE